MGHEQMETWSTTVKARRQDVLGDFVGKELIAVHGESMLLHCLRQDQVDMKDGLQLLHAVHAVERFLRKIRDRDCCFHVLWFATHESLLLSAHADATTQHKLRLVRAVLIEHLRQHPEAVQSVCFASMDCAPYRQYLAETLPRLFVVSNREPANTDKQVLTFESIIFRLNTEGHTVSIIDDMIRATLFPATVGLAFDKTDWPSIPLPSCWSDDTDPARIDPAAAFHDLGSSLCSLRARLSVAALATLLQSNGNNTPAMRARATTLLAHVAILEACPLAHRPVHSQPAPMSVPDRDDDVLFLNMFCAHARTLLEHRPWADDADASDYEVYDLVDERIWLAVRDRPFTPAMVARSRELVASLSALCGGIDLLSYLPDPVCSSSADDAPRAVHVGSVLPFSHPEFDNFLGSVVVEIESEDEVEDEDDGDEEEATPVHYKLTQPRATPKETARMLRRNQRRMADMQAYASSLTNASGKVLEPEIVVTVKKIEKTKKTVAAGKKAQKTKTKALQDQKGRRAPEILARWRTAYDNLAKEHDPLARYRAATRYMQGLSLLEREVVGADAVLHLCAVLGGCLAGDKQQAAPDPTALTALLWTHIQELAQLQLSEEAVQLTQALCAAVGLVVGPLSAAADAADHELLAKPEVQQVVTRLTGKGQRLPPPPLDTEFQLAHCGPYLERGFDAQVDARVTGFAPDGWQRQVLDTIDARESLLVVAPTSAGKTFISFYAMKQVLQESDDGVLVYVAPTKALVNQVAAEVQARFTKASSSSSVWSVLTRDYRINNPTSCQILVTEPDILLSLLLAPQSIGGSGIASRPWPPRLRWIIFDEVHCIGQADEGVVWEQLLLLAPCPLLALSATVGNPGEFQAWLAGCERTKGRTLRTITHSARYSDLRSYVWVPPPEEKGFTGFFVPAKAIVHTRRWPIPGLEADDDNDTTPFTFVHPVAGLMDRSRPTLDDLGFEPRDCLLLWRTLARHATDAFPVDPALAPAVFFAQRLPAALTKARVATWESRLKAVLLQWLHDRRSPFPAVLQDLSPRCLLTTTETETETDTGTGTPPPSISAPLTPTDPDFSARILRLLADLQRRAAIPALLFLYNRVNCEQTLQAVVDGLMAAEQAWKATSAQWQATLAAFSKHEAAASARRKQQPKKTTRDKGDDGVSKLDNLREAASAETYSKWDSFSPDEPLPAFSLADTTKLLVTERERQIAALAYLEMPAFFIEGLRRGVGVHHAGMNRRYRQTVEMLFRRGYLTVVVATGTLALGINMPCRTVVFLGDSTRLTALNYRQASGRAGRRGFDLLGNVVFYDFAPSRVRALLTVRLPDLRGIHHVALTPSLVLRACMLLHGNTGTFARETVRALCAQTRVSMVGPVGSETVAHHLRFVFEFLRRGGLLSAKGVPRSRGPAGLVARLAYAEEDGAFALAALLRGGYFQQECAAVATAGPYDTHEEQALLDRLVLVLAHLFGRRLYRGRGVSLSSSSSMALPPLPAAAAALLRQHNARTRGTLHTYMHSYVRQHLAGEPDRSLPLTGTVVGPDDDTDNNNTTTLRSPFAALSGWTDDRFRSARELCDTARAGVDVEAAIAATQALPLAPDGTENVLLNAYLYDFFRHGDLAAITHSENNGNGISLSDVWFVLHDFGAVLAAIVAGLKQLVDGPEAAGTAAEDLATEDRLPVGDGDKDWDENRAGEPVRVARPAVPTKKPPRKAKVADSWEDASSDDDGGGGNVPGARPTGATDHASRREGLRAVLQAFVKIEAQFDEKFRKIWA